MPGLCDRDLQLLGHLVDAAYLGANRCGGQCLFALFASDGLLFLTMGLGDLFVQRRHLVGSSEFRFFDCTERGGEGLVGVLDPLLPFPLRCALFVAALLARFELLCNSWRAPPAPRTANRGVVITHGRLLTEQIVKFCQSPSHRVTGRSPVPGTAHLKKLIH
ncbi:hypothetical protein A9X06_04835 [Mycobacterium sp. 852002-51759_SCH5129042]|nr:hypothetical protein A9X06_04835 [Mycobacterium sp. 852002-51759_SCH5129042]